MIPKKISVVASPLLLLTSTTTISFSHAQQTQQTIYSGTGFGTYYYDMQQIDACGTSFSFQNLGYVKCPFSGGMTLDQINSNYLVAMNNTQLSQKMNMYCGKKVVVTSVNGNPVTDDLPLYIGDGCARCADGSAEDDQTWNSVGAPGLDFSYSVLNQLSGGGACDAGHFAITWEILDEQVYPYDAGDEASSTPEPVPTATATTTSAVEGGGTQSVPPAGPSTTGAQMHNQKDEQASSTATTLITSTQQPPAGPNTAPPSACLAGSWQCSPNNAVLEQCYNSVWNPRVTCAAGQVCQGGDVPYCAASGFS